MKLEIIDNTCPYCREHVYANKKSFANHIRWCISNPRYKEIREGTISKLRDTSAKQEYSCICKVCGSTYTINCTPHAYEKGVYRKTCSDRCAKQLTASNTDIEKKNKKISEKLKGYKIVNGERIKVQIYTTKTCPCCGTSFDARGNQIFCSTSCRKTYKILQKLSKVEDKALILKDIWYIYRNECSFKFALNEFPKEFDFSLIEESGWYKASNHGNNLDGISRDHMISCRYGYDNNIDPYVISHPANCKLMSHHKNSSKYTDCSISIKELEERIRTWNNRYGIYPNKIDYSKLENIGFNFNRYKL